MIQTLKRQFCVLRYDGRWLFGLTAGIGIIGVIIYQIILGVEQEDGAYVPLGTILAAGTLLIMILALIMSEFAMYFNIEVSMGCTRGQFFLSFFLTSLVMSLFGYGLVLLVSLGEDALNAAVHPELTIEVAVMPYLLRWGFPVVLLAVICSMFFATLVLRYGKRAYWILWAVWMILCLGFPRVVEAIGEAPDSLFGKIGSAAIRLFSGVSPEMWILVSVLAGVIGLTGTYLFLRRQQVTS